MFEDEGCTRAEAELRAAVLGKTYSECKVEWSRQFKKEFILANSNLLESFNMTPDNEGMHCFTFAMSSYDPREAPVKSLLQCGNVECTLENGLWRLTVSFHADEIGERFIDEVADKTSARSHVNVQCVKQALCLQRDAELS